MDKLKILVVDDESRMRKLVRDFLVKNDFDVVEAEDGEQAIDVFYADKNISLIILDVMMPKMNGVQDNQKGFQGADYHAHSQVGGAGRACRIQFGR